MSNYLKLFETTSEYTQYIEQGSPLLPNVSYCEDERGVHYNPWKPHDYSKDYFTIVVTEGGHIGFNPAYTDGDIFISKDNKKTWDVCGSEGIDVSEGDNISVKCMINSPYDGKKFITNTDNTFKAKIQGNIMSLLLGDNFMDVTVLENNYLSYLFDNNYWLIDAQNLVLPAMELAEDSYQYMFDGCTSLTQAPELPATSLADGCYSYMFCGCSSLVTAPELPATELKESCYYMMFRSCTSLVTAPELPATTLADNCYGYMFYDCTSLNYIKTLFTTDISQSSSYTSKWLNNVSATGTFVGNAEATWLDNFTRGNSTVPANWTIEKE